MDYINVVNRDICKEGEVGAKYCLQSGRYLFISIYIVRLSVANVQPDIEESYLCLPSNISLKTFIRELNAEFMEVKTTSTL